MLDKIIDSLYGLWYSILDYKIYSILVFFLVSISAFGAYVFFPESFNNTGDSKIPLIKELTHNITGETQDQENQGFINIEEEEKETSIIQRIINKVTGKTIQSTGEKNNTKTQKNSPVGDERSLISPIGKGTGDQEIPTETIEKQQDEASEKNLSIKEKILAAKSKKDTQNQISVPGDNDLTNQQYTPQIEQKNTPKSAINNIDSSINTSTITNISPLDDTPTTPSTYTPNNNSVQGDGVLNPASTTLTSSIPSSETPVLDPPSSTLSTPISPNTGVNSGTSTNNLEGDTNLINSSTSNSRNDIDGNSLTSNNNNTLLSVTDNTSNSSGEETSFNTEPLSNPEGENTPTTPNTSTSNATDGNDSLVVEGSSNLNGEILPTSSAPDEAPVSPSSSSTSTLNAPDTSETTNSTSAPSTSNSEGNTSPSTSTPPNNNSDTSNIVIPTNNNGGTTPGNTGADGSPIETIVDQYFENNGVFDTGGGNFIPIRVIAVHSRSPIRPIPAVCPSGYSLFGINSNIFDDTTISLPYNTGGNSMSLSNEIISRPESDYYFKIFNVNGVKIGGVIYKVGNPDIDYHWAFTVCLNQ